MFPDPHSYTNLEQGRVAAAELTLTVDFTERRLRGRARLNLTAPASGAFDLDTRDLDIARVRTPDGQKVAWELADADPILGSRLRLTLPADTTAVDIHYATSPAASALQWLAPAQTAGGEHPYLFSQCQAIHARAVAPLQDTPVVRITFEAAVTVPDPLRVVMAAAMDEPSPGETPGTTCWHFHMPQPIPPYLLALAAGNLATQELGPRTRIYCEPEMLAQAAWEFAGVEDMIRTAEGLFGDYPWDRFDLLCMPPSFPYGGMENPRLTFLTPTLLAGDRSLVNVVVHELAHSWTGNLVTNANMEHFWLNEGFTVYAERRILEALHGPEHMGLHAAVGRNGLQRELERFGPDSPYTRLRTELVGVDPDDVFSLVPYEKGFLFVRRLHEAAGQKRFDDFLRTYIERFRFSTLTTEQFLDFVREQLPGVLDQVDAQAWLYQPGVPADEPTFGSAAKQEAEALAAGWAEGKRPNAAQVKHWLPEQWLIYLEALPDAVDPADCAALDERFGLTAQGNAEILAAWLRLAVRSGHAPAVQRALEWLGEVGRMKFLKPLYAALASHPDLRVRAQARFAELRDTYHPIARQVVRNLLEAE